LGRTVKIYSVLRRLSALFFLSVMILFIGLQSPVLGYCAAENEVFVGAHLVGFSCDHGCEHEAPPVQIPCEEEHDFVTVDPGDFQWSPLSALAPPVLVAEDFEFVSRPLFFEERAYVCLMGLPDPPPPDVPIFRRDAALRV
jgi:hypothetical protein